MAAERDHTELQPDQSESGYETFRFGVVVHISTPEYADPFRVACGRRDMPRERVVTFEHARTGRYRVCRTCQRVLKVALDEGDR